MRVIPKTLGIKYPRKGWHAIKNQSTELKDLFFPYL